MGWLYSSSWSSKSALISHLCEGNGIKTLAKCVRGNVLYTVHVQYGKDDLPENRFIGVYLLGADGPHGWGYKDMCEGMHPYYFGCPLAYFELVPVVACEAWREACRAAAAKRAVKVKVGSVVVLRTGCSPSRLRVTCVKPLRGEANGCSFRIPRRYIDRVEEG